MSTTNLAYNSISRLLNPNLEATISLELNNPIGRSPHKSRESTNLHSTYQSCNTRKKKKDLKGGVFK